MPRTRRASSVPQTPDGTHMNISDLSADEIEFDDEIAIKSSVFRGEKYCHKKCGPLVDQNVRSTPKKTPK